MKNKIKIKLMITPLLIGVIIGLHIEIVGLNKEIKVLKGNVQSFQRTLKVKDKELESSKLKIESLEKTLNLKESDIKIKVQELNKYKKDISFNPNNVRELSNISFPN